jgi:hypothetical protein
VKKLAILFVLILSGCQQNAAISACETFIKERLRAPSTYKKISDDGVSSAFEFDGKTIKMVTIEYDAANAYGTPIRESQQCTFEVDKSGSFVEKDLGHAARMASIGSDPDYGSCCVADNKNRLPDDPDKAVAAAIDSANAAMKAANEAEEAALKAIGEVK